MDVATVLEPSMEARERAWDEGEHAAARLMGTINASTAGLCEVMATLIANEGWAGAGIASPEHWATWKAGISTRRARNLGTVARRIDELPLCFGLFREGRITEDSMVRIARRVPAKRDAEFAGIVLLRTVSQLDRLLAHLPILDQIDPGRPESSRRHLHISERDDGWGRGTFELPPEVVLHRDLCADGTLGPAQLHGSVVQLPDPLAKYLACDAQVRMVITSGGKLLGITPTERTPNRALRRYLERRDRGCAHPLCSQKLWLHAHHLLHWEDGGPTIASNLLMLCPQCHRSLHLGDFTIEGDPEVPTSLVFRDARGRPIEPPVPGPPISPDPGEPSPFIPPPGERCNAAWFSWN
jgi:hypothetical protein